MKKKLLTIILLCSVFSATAQKQLLDNNSYKTWATLCEISHNVSSIITNDGLYVGYKYNPTITLEMMAVKSVDGSYKKEFRNVGEVYFTADSRRMTFRLNGDSLGILTLGTSNMVFVGGIISFSIPKRGNGEWLAYQQTNKDLILKDLFTGFERNYGPVEEYRFDDEGNTLLVRKENTLLWCNLITNKEKNIFRGLGASHIIVDATFEQLAFVTPSDSGINIRYYKDGMDSAKLLIDCKTGGVGAGFILSDEFLQFSPDGNKIFFRLKEKSAVLLADASSKKRESNVSIWHYNDLYLPSTGPFNIGGASPLFAASDIEHPRIVQLTNAQTFILSSLGNPESNKYVLTQTMANADEFNWNKEVMTLYLTGTSDGNSRVIKTFTKEYTSLILLSPNEKYVIWFDNRDKKYYSFEISSGTTRDISKGIAPLLYDKDADIISRRIQYGIAGWMKDDSALLIYSRYDIWKVDPKGKNPPTNITGGFGANHHTVFRRIDAANVKNKLIDKDTLIITGFNNDNKQNGFFKLLLNRNTMIEKLTMGDYVYHFASTSRDILVVPSEDIPQKAKNANVYIIRRMSARESPNLFFTTDFKSYIPITDFYPERKYNWLKTELVSWKNDRGKRSLGILYKPENFDSTKKYPLILFYYEKLSNELNVYKGPDLSPGNLSIPWYVSNGYLVFVPDIYYNTGHPANSTVNCIRFAVKRLSMYPFVNMKKMGVEGHSFGGVETVFLISQLNIFAAAQASSGVYNATSYYGYYAGDFSINRNSYYDSEQGNIACAPWQCPDLYIENSSIFHVQNIHTPLLMMANKGDMNVPFSQSIELFTALRRLHQQVWLLDYGGYESHGLGNPLNKRDFTLRQQAFFDHYLRDRPAPRWMSIVGCDDLGLDNTEKVQ